VFHETQFHYETVFRETFIFVKTKIMARKQWSAKTEITPSLLKSREKRKWQIALRRYVIGKNPSVYYAPFFGLDIENFRTWIQMQFESGTDWEDFGKKWQFDHIIPVTYFDFSNEAELKLCWNFTNISAGRIQKNREGGSKLDLWAAKQYFEQLYKETNYPICQRLLERIEQIQLLETVDTSPQQTFLLQNREYLDVIQDYRSFEFELLNSGRSIEEVKKEAAFLKKFK
jgi:hypothetical protein